MLLRACARLLREEGRRAGRLALDSDLEIDKLVGEGGHGVGEAERVGACRLRGEDKVSLALFFAGRNGLVVGASDGVVYVEGAA